MSGEMIVLTIDQLRIRDEQFIIQTIEKVSTAASEKMISSKELGELTGFGGAYISRAANRKNDPMPHYGSGKGVRFLYSEVKEWLKRQ